MNGPLKIQIPNIVNFENIRRQTRTGVTTSVVEDFVETRNDRIVSVSIVPFMRARTIEVDATNLNSS